MTTAEMDRLAATGVMGWEWNGEITQTNRWMFPNGQFAARYDWSPATDERQAAMVREKMRAEGWEVSMVAHKRGDTVTICKSGGPWWTSERGVGQMPLALTATALLACGLATEEEING